MTVTIQPIMHLHTFVFIFIVNPELLCIAKALRVQRNHKIVLLDQTFSYLFPYVILGAPECERQYIAVYFAITLPSLELRRAEKKNIYEKKTLLESFPHLITSKVPCFALLMRLY